MQDELDSANAHLSADYFFPKDAPGHKGVTAIAVRDRATKFLTGHVVEQKGAGQQGAVSQLLKDLRKMGLTSLSKSLRIEELPRLFWKRPLEVTPRLTGKRKMLSSPLSKWLER